AIGTIILVGMVMVGVVLVGMLLLSGPTATKVPVFDAIISNQSKTVYIYHKGGDALYAGTYKVFVNGNDSTAYFSIMSPYGDPFSVGKTLVGTLPYLPVHVAIVYNQTGGGSTVVAGQDLYGTVTLTQNPNAWYFNPTANNCSWRYRKKITLSHALVSGDQVNFPVLVTLTSDPDISAHARTDGFDLLFTQSDGTTKIPFQNESYAAGSLVAWVNVPALSSSADTVIYLYYGNTSSTATQQNPTAVWDSNFLAVWHFTEKVGGAGALKDSTSSGNHGTNQGNVFLGTAGQIGNAVTLDGSNEFISTNNQFNPQAPQVFTESLWFRTANATPRKLFGSETRQTGVTLDTEGWDRQMYIGTGGILVGGVFNESGNGGNGDCVVVKTAGAVSDGAWHLAAMTFDSNVEKLYLDGGYIGMNTSGLAEIKPEYFRMGSYKLTGWPVSNGDGFFNGTLDEVELSGSVRSAGWLATEYANQKYPTLFSSVGSEETWWKC
ncbi:MAG TPA: DUF2341 domain-containing protein, partial [Methanomicrobiales archaeon]|nr:DUF2341 domain-containing protein [Methanomicrobiales archaeon]